MMRLIEKFSSLFAVVTILALSAWTVGCGGDTGAPTDGGTVPADSQLGDDYDGADDGHSHDDEAGSTTGEGVDLPGDDGGTDDAPADDAPVDGTPADDAETADDA
jgi:hypothetical protein